MARRMISRPIIGRQKSSKGVSSYAGLLDSVMLLGGWESGSIAVGSCQEFKNSGTKCWDNSRIVAQCCIGTSLVNGFVVYVSGGR